jgi:dTDP-4-dehydrorhamnose reductase
MKVLVTGANGQLGSRLVLDLHKSGHDVLPVGRKEIDFSMPEQVEKCIADARADWVVNCAAYTQVDRAEAESELALTVNRDSAASVARGVASYGGRLMHVSTDFVFNGRQSTPYREDDSPDPLCAYGRSKWEGEQSVREAMPAACIVRTSWVYGIHGNNFVKTILRLAREREALRVVDDQVGVPSWTTDISRAILSLIDRDANGFWHFSNEGVASWYDFAQAIVQEATRLGFTVKAREIEAIPTKEFPTPATRPAYSVLDKQKIRGGLSWRIPYWRDSLVAMLAEVKTCADC